MWKEWEREHLSTLHLPLVTNGMLRDMAMLATHDWLCDRSFFEDPVTLPIDIQTITSTVGALSGMPPSPEFETVLHAIAALACAFTVGMSSLRNQDRLEDEEDAVDLWDVARSWTSCEPSLLDGIAIRLSVLAALRRVTATDTDTAIAIETLLLAESTGFTRAEFVRARYMIAPMLVGLEGTLAVWSEQLDRQGYNKVTETPFGQLWSGVVPALLVTFDAL